MKELLDKAVAVARLSPMPVFCFLTEQLKCQGSGEVEQQLAVFVTLFTTEAALKSRKTFKSKNPRLAASCSLKATYSLSKKFSRTATSLNHPIPHSAKAPKR